MTIPRSAKPYRADGLWRTTCLELFLREEDDGYREFNFSPSTQWAAYRFAGYRDDMEPVALDTPPRVNVWDEGYALIVSVELELRIGSARMGLSAVVEELDGTKSYWALAHPPGAPDFHHPDCFAAELPAPGNP